VVAFVSNEMNRWIWRTEFLSSWVHTDYSEDTCSRLISLLILF
jgi:hypothetical protein